MSTDPSPEFRSVRERGAAVRREVPGNGHVDAAFARADEFTGDFQELATSSADGERT